MSNKEKMEFAWLGALGLSLVMGLQAPDVWGQSATDVVCSGCIQGSDIQNGTIGPNKLIPGSINGTTIANQSIGPNKLIPGSINAATIANQSIGTNKLIPGSINATVIANHSIGPNKLIPGSINSTALSSEAVQGDNVIDGSLTGNDIADSSITGADIANFTLNRVHIQNGAIIGQNIAPSTIRMANMAPRSIGSEQISRDAVGGSEVQDNSLSSRHLINNAGADYVDGTDDVDLPADGSDLIVRSVTLTAPSFGVAVAMATGQIFNGIPTNGDFASCGITQETTNRRNEVISVSLSDTVRTAAVVKTRGFFIDPDSNVFNFICSQAIGSSITVSAPSLVVFFVPARY